MGGEPTFVHPSAVVEDGAQVGPGTKIWALSQVRSTASVGAECVIGRNVFVDADVRIGDRVKVQNNASLYEGVELEDGVFVGPHVVFTNDRLPRAITPSGKLKTLDDWQLERTVVRAGAAVGARSVVVTGVEIGRWSMIGAGTVVTRDVPAHALVLGNPGRIVGYVSAGGDRFSSAEEAVAASERERTQEAT